MSDVRGFGLAWVFVALVAVAGMTLFLGGAPAGASDDHEGVREMRSRGEVLPLVEMLQRPELAGLRVIEADLERKHGRMVYELELLDDRGRVHRRYFDAATGRPVQRRGDDD